MNTVVVYRRDLFKVSEHFITQQASCHTWQTVFAGHELHGEAPPGATYVLRPQKSLAAVVAFRPTVVHVHFGLDIPPAARLAQALNVPLVATLHGFDVTRTTSSCVRSLKPNLTLYGLRRSSILNLPALNLAVSSYIRQKAIDCGASPQSVRIHHMGSAVGDLSASRMQERANGAPCYSIIHVARLVAKKGTTYLLAAAKRLADRGVAFHLDIVGTGPMLKELKTFTQALGLTRLVTFLGERKHDEVVKRIESAALMCLPSLEAPDGDAEGLGMVILEAAAAGTPIVASRSGGIVDFVTDHVTGLLVEPGDEEGLSHALELALRDRVLSENLTKNARARLEQDFDVRVQTRKLEGIFEEVSMNYCARGRE